MPFDARQQEILRTWSAAKSAMSCPLCKGKDWQIADLILPPLISHATAPTGEGIPLLEVICKRCGNVLFFSAEHLGL